MKKLLVFDWDGVLFNTMSIMEESYIRTLGKLGRPMVDEATLRSFIGPSDDDNARSLGFTDPADIRRFMRTLWEEEFEVNLDRGELYPGIRDMLLALHEKHEMCVVSNGGYNHVHVGLVKFRILPLFEDITTSRDNRKKPESFARLARVYPDCQLVSIGDRRGDMEAGLSVGALCVGTRYGYGSPEEFVGAQYTVDSPQELRKVLLSL